jgi:PAS domain S-box-containing protein
MGIGVLFVLIAGGLIHSAISIKALVKNLDSIAVANQQSVLIERYTRLALTPDNNNEKPAIRLWLINSLSALKDGGPCPGYTQDELEHHTTPSQCKSIVVLCDRLHKQLSSLFDLAEQNSDAAPITPENISEIIREANDAIQTSNKLIKNFSTRNEALRNDAFRVSTTLSIAAFFVGVIVILYLRDERQRILSLNISNAIEADKLNHLLETVDEGILTFDHTGRITYANPAAERLLSAPKYAIEESHISTWLSALEETTGAKDIDGLFSGPRTDITHCTIEGYFNKKNAVGRWLYISIRRMPFANQESFYIVMLRDITKLKEENALLSDQNKQLESLTAFARCENRIMACLNRRAPLADLMNGTLVILSEDLKISTSVLYLINEGKATAIASHGVALTDVPMINLQSGHLDIITNQPQTACTRSNSGNAFNEILNLQQGSPMTTAHHACVSPALFNGVTIGILAVAINESWDDFIYDFLDKVGTHLGLAIHNQEFERLETLTRELHKRESQIASQNEDLVKANKLKSEFLATMSHELRTPLNAIMGFSEILKDQIPGKLNDHQRDYANEIFTSGQHLLSLINDILDLSKVEAGKMDVNLTTVDLPRLTTNALTILKDRAQRQGVSLINHVPEGIGLIRTDERKLKQILYNLLTNAVKFTPRGGSVTLHAELTPASNSTGTQQAGPDEFELLVSVRDTGIGIAQEDQGKLFQPFLQLHSSATREYEGTGLGLSLCKQLLSLLEGTISVESELGKGACFTIKLPVTKAHPPPQNDITLTAPYPITP